MVAHCTPLGSMAIGREEGRRALKALERVQRYRRPRIQEKKKKNGERHALKEAKRIRLFLVSDWGKG